MKSTKRFKAALAAVLVLALSPLFGGVAFAEGSSAVTYGGNKTAVTDPSTIWDWSGLIKSDTSSVGRIWTDKTVSDGEISKERRHHIQRERCGLPDRAHGVVVHL